MDVNIELEVDENLRFFADTSFQQSPSAPPSTPNSNASSPPTLNDDIAMASQSFLHNNSLFNQSNGADSSLGSLGTVECKSLNSKRGPGRPRKDMPMLVFRDMGKTVQKRKNNKNPLHVPIAPSSSESSNMGFPDDKQLAYVDDSPHFLEKYPGKTCCLCNLTERSALGQGDFLRLETANDFNEALFDPSEDEKTALDDCSRVSELPTGAFRRQKNTSKHKLPSNSECINELEKIGQIDSLPLRAIIDGNYLYVHRMCAMWSLGISPNNIDDLPNIELVADKSLKQKCSYCGQYGASISCKMSCQKKFHLPCAAASGCFLIIETFTAFCATHLNHVPSMCPDTNIDCRQCSALGDISKLIMCSTCGDHYHTTCIGLANLPDTRSGWNCSQCSKCQICRISDSTEGRSVKCEQCQKLYHATCLRPIVSSIPKYGWKCYRCRLCTDCGSRTPGAGTSSRWHCHYTICDSCYQQRNKGFSCPICHKAYRAAAHKEMVKCSWCHRFVHSSCDGEADLNVYHAKKENNPDYDYMCPPCKNSSHNEKIQIANNQMRSSDESFDNPTLSSIMQSEGLYKDGDVEYMERSCLEYNSTDGKACDILRISKKRPGFKEFQRGRGGKVVQQKTGALTQFGRKRNARGKGRHLFLLSNMNMGELGDRGNNRSTEDDQAMEKKLLLCSAKDKFILSQDICVMCGSVGIDQEGCLIACAQCGQCYHPYCVNVKVTKVILEKGWRCLDCTICEGCGQKNDEARLILCDECDISYHIYCMNPPLDTVPHGNWKCTWCAICQKCGRNSPGLNSTWRNGFMECGPCASQTICCVCARQYNDNELIIQCSNCERWLHCQCDSISNEEEAQLCDNTDYRCVLCRPKGNNSSHILAVKNISKSAISPTNTYSNTSAHISNIKTEHGSASHSANQINDNYEMTHLLDGICVSERGLNMIKSLSTEIKRKRKLRPTNNALSKDSGIIAAIESVVAASSTNNAMEGRVDGAAKIEENYKDGMVWTGPDNNPPEGFSISTNDEGMNILRKKRQRNLQKLGIGGFNVRNRAFKKESEEATADTSSAIDIEKKKKVVRKKLKSKLSETYPIYLQEAFFGKTLLDTKHTPLSICETDSSEEFDGTVGLICQEKNTSTKEEFLNQNTLENLGKTNTLKIKEEIDDKPVDTNPSLLEQSSIENISHSAEVHCRKAGVVEQTKGTLLTHSAQESLSKLQFSGIKMNEKSGDISGTAAFSDIPFHPVTSDVPTLVEHMSPAMPLESVANPSLELQSNIFDLQLKTKNPDLCFKKPPSADAPLHQNNMPHDQMQILHALHKPPQQVQKAEQRSSQAQIQIHRPIHTHSSQMNDNSLSNTQINLQLQRLQNEPTLQQKAQTRVTSECTSKAYLAQTPPDDTTEVNVAGTQKTAEKMRRDEDLGEMATISAVLYANTQHPELKKMYPNWNDRCKQILKRWRSLSTEKKSPFLQHAKDNRSALRMRRAQQDQEKICFQQKTLKEQEQERIWKQHQAKAKEAQTTVFGSDTSRNGFESNFGSESGSVGGKHSSMYTSNLIPDTQHPNLNSNVIANPVLCRNVEAIPIQQPDQLLEKSENHQSVSENKQLRTLLLKQGYAGPWTSDTNASAQGPMFQQNSSFKITNQQDVQKIKTIQYNELKRNISATPTKSVSMCQGIQPDQIPINTNKQDHKGRYDVKMVESTETVAASDLEKLDQDENAGFGDILGGLGEGDDDDLLKSLTAEIGDDFNILEYADPELDELATNQNLLNKLDFDDNDKNT